MLSYLICFCNFINTAFHSNSPVHFISFEGLALTHLIILAPGVLGTWDIKGEYKIVPAFN